MGKEVEKPLDIRPEEVIALADRLRQLHEETVTLSELKKAGVEIGIEHSYVQKATEILVQQKAKARSAPRKILTTKAELTAWIGVFVIPVAVAAIAYFVGLPYRNAGAAPAALVAFIILPLFAMWTPGFLTGRKRSGLVGGLWLASCMLLAMKIVYADGSGTSLISSADIQNWLSYAIPAVGFGVLSGWLRARVSPPSWMRTSVDENLDRELLMESLQRSFTASSSDEEPQTQGTHA